jgi:hypothetical protein
MDSKPEVKNPQAFPVATHAVVRPGMTLRDYFAGQALQGMYSNASFDDVIKQVLAVVAYEQADAMMKARGDG